MLIKRSSKILNLDNLKDDIITDYLLENQSIQKLAEKYSTSRFIIKKLLAEHSVERTPEQHFNYIEYQKFLKVEKAKCVDWDARNSKSRKTKLDRYGSETWCNYEKCHSTTLNKYGAIGWACAEILDKARTTCIEKYGVDHHLKTQEGLDKQKRTCRERYGVDNVFQNHEIKEQIKYNRFIATGFEHSSQNPETKMKIKETCLNRYGYTHHNQNPTIWESRVDYRYKDYTLPSGKVVRVMGYENLAIDLLLNDYNEHDLMLENKPAIEYFWSSDDGFGDDKLHMYHPDIIIIKEHKIIEVKSKWTYSKDSKTLSKNKAKEAGSIAAGWKFEFMIL